MSEGETIEFQNATVVDGSGAEPYDGHVLVTEGRISRVGSQPCGRAERIVDVDGAYLAPGFIDMHAHSELHLFDHPRAQEKVTQGVTTAVFGQDGVSVAPTPEELTDEWQQRVQSLLGTVDEWSWTAVSEFLDSLQAARPSINCAYYVPHGNLRSTVAGFEDRALTPAEVSRLRERLDAALDQGGFALSKGMIYPPSSYGRDDEFVACADVLGARDTFFVSHVWNETDYVSESIERFVDICERGGCQPHVSHLKVGGEQNWGRSEEVLSLFDAANDRNTTVTYDQYPYTAGSTMLTALLPPWARRGDADETVERLQDPDTVGRIREDIRSSGRWENLARAAGTWDNVLVTRTGSGAHEGQPISEIATEWGVEPVATVCKLLVEEELDVTMADFIMSEADIERFLADERGTICTDGILGGKPHPRAIGTFPRVLERYVADRGVLSVADAVYKAAGHPADVLGLPERGRIEEGYTADLVVFDLDQVSENCTYEDPSTLSTGMEYVLVGGVPVVDGSTLTGARPGDVLRSTEVWGQPTRPKLDRQ